MELIAKDLKSGDWVSSTEIHRKLSKQVAESMFGRAKAALGVEHRRVRGESGARYEWRLPEEEVVPVAPAREESGLRPTSLSASTLGPACEAGTLAEGRRRTRVRA